MAETIPKEEASTEVDTEQIYRNATKILELLQGTPYGVVSITMKAGRIVLIERAESHRPD